MRYWKVISLLVIIVLSIGTYYVQNALAESNLPKVKLEMVQGEENEVENLILMASLLDHNKASYENVRITSGESLYGSELSYFASMKGDFYNPATTKLEEEYRSFMRGKSGYSGLFESNESLVYVGPSGIDRNDDSFEIEILDKNSSETTSFQVDIPEKDNQYISIVDVQVIQEELIAVTRNFYPTRPDEMETGEEFHVYRISLEDQTVTSHESIYQSKADDSNRRWSHISEVNSYTSIGQEEYFVFRVVYVDESQEFEEPARESSEYFAYHYEAGKLVEMEISEEAIDAGTNAYVEGSTLYFLNTLEEELQIIEYNIDDEQLNTMDIPTKLDILEMNTHAMVENEKMYIPSSDFEGNHVFIVDLNNGDLLYEGELITDSNLGSAYFDIYEVVVE